MSWDWLVPVVLFGPFVWMLVTMHIEDSESAKREDKE